MSSLITVIGGIGFFLLGMNLMADGLKSIAGDSLKKLLHRFTGGTFSSITTGTIITLLVQSSTATTLMTIGFVSAGMLTFIQATGVIFGSNLGTTSTGWMVAFIGLKFSISQLALPLIGLGVLLKQFSKGKLAHTGMVLTGFGLLFIGIQFLQDGMAGLNAYLDLSAFTGSSIWHRLLLILFGIVMTIVMQSSSAAVATTITVLATGGIELDQAIAVVIGQNIGTTATAAIAAIGASTSSKRTATAHILFNLSTGFIAFLLFPFIMVGLRSTNEVFGWTDPAMTLALFHTAFSLVGILIFAPFIKQFTNVIAWMLPEKKSSITKHLDMKVVQIPEVAIETAFRALQEATSLTLTATIGKFASYTPGSIYYGKTEQFDSDLQFIQDEMDEVRAFAGKIITESRQSTTNYTAVLHAIDHLGRINRLVRTGMKEVRFTNQSGALYPVVAQLQEILSKTLEAFKHSEIEQISMELAAFSQSFASFRKQERANTFDITANGEVALSDAFDYIQLVLLIDGISYHIWRLSTHLSASK